jgi:hypothetical protein
MNRNWRVVLPPRGITALFCAAYLLTYLMDVYFIIRFGVPCPKEVGVIRMPILAWASISYAIYRSLAFHPFYNRKYREWLCLTPWSADKPLPKGPVHLIWVDLVALVLLTLLAYSNMPIVAPVPATLFLAVYVVLLCITFEGKQVSFAVVFLFAAPFVIFPHKNEYLAVLVLIALYILCWMGLRRFWRGFPWNTKYWKADPVKELREQARRQGVIGWPFSYLSAYESRGISVFEAFLLSLLLTWWLHVIHWVIGGSFGLFNLSLLSLLVAMFRSVTYSGVHRPPISLLGRIFTGRLIIPRYDKIYIAPMCILLAGTLLPLGLRRLGLETVWNLELCFFVIFFLAFSLPPSLRRWQLTGAHRVARHVQSMKPRAPSPQNETLAAFFSGKLKSREQVRS